MTDEPAARAHALLEHLFQILHEFRALVPQLERGPEGETPSAEAERLPYYALTGAIEAGLVRTAENALTVLRQASAPLGRSEEHTSELQSLRHLVCRPLDLPPFPTRRSSDLGAPLPDPARVPRAGATARARARRRDAECRGRAPALLRLDRGDRGGAGPHGRERAHRAPPSERAARKIGRAHV